MLPDSIHADLITSADLCPQVSRLFIANFIRSHFSHSDSIDDIYVITSDADLWPIDGAAYRLPVGKDVMSLNAYCCGSFEHNGSSYRMLPLSNIGMKIRTWYQVTHRWVTGMAYKSTAMHIYGSKLELGRYTDIHPALMQVMHGLRKFLCWLFGQHARRLPINQSTFI